MSDLISRQDVYCILEKMMIDRPLDSDRWVIRDIDKEIKSLPSVDRPMGEWLLEEQKSQKHIESIYICPVCRNFEAWGKTELYNYCPNCGADMRGNKE